MRRFVAYDFGTGEQPPRKKRRGSVEGDPDTLDENPTEPVEEMPPGRDEFDEPAEPTNPADDPVGE
jgi:hypothetical protein